MRSGFIHGHGVCVVLPCRAFLCKAATDRTCRKLLCPCSAGRVSFSRLHCLPSLESVTCGWAQSHLQGRAEHSALILVAAATLSAVYLGRRVFRGPSQNLPQVSGQLETQALPPGKTLLSIQSFCRAPDSETRHEEPANSWAGALILPPLPLWP